MALTPTTTLTQTNDCLKLTATDTSLYDSGSNPGGVPKRTDSNVIFLITEKLTAGGVDRTPTHTPATVVSVDITTPAPQDGFWEVKITVSNSYAATDTIQAGTVTATTGSAALVGAGTTFTSLSPGDRIKIETEIYYVDVITDATNMTVTRNYVGTGGAGLSFFKDPAYTFVTTTNNGITCLSEKCQSTTTLKVVVDRECGCEDPDTILILDEITQNIKTMKFKANNQSDLTGMQIVAERTRELCESDACKC